MSKHRTLIPGVKHLTKGGTCLCECRECSNPFNDEGRCICPDCTGPCCVNNPLSDQDQ